MSDWTALAPPHWVIRSLGRSCRVATGDRDTIDAQPEGDVPFYVRSAEVQRIDMASASGEAILTPGDGAVGEIFHHHKGGAYAAHQRVYVIDRFAHDLLPRFFYWYFSATFGLLTRQGTAKSTVDSLRRPMFTSFPVLIPPLPEQSAIADYLDRETAKIDTLMEKQTTMIERLRERRAALSENVLAPFVGSGTRLRFLVRESDHRAGTRARALPLMSVSIATGVGARSDDNRQAASEDVSRYKIARRGDIVINRMRAFQGGLGDSPYDGIVSPDYAVLGVMGDTDPAWMGAVMRTTSFVAEMSARLRGIGTSEGGQVRTPRINVSDLLNIRMHVPSRSEQESILGALDREAAKIDTLIAKVERHIELAKERRAALISAAVTGRIDVTTTSKSGDAA